MDRIEIIRIMGDMFLEIAENLNRGNMRELSYGMAHFASDCYQRNKDPDGLRRARKYIEDFEQYVDPSSIEKIREQIPEAISKILSLVDENVGDIPYSPGIGIFIKDVLSRGFKLGMVKDGFYR